MKTVNITPEEALQLMGRIPSPAAKNAIAVLEKYVRTYKISEAKDDNDRDLISRALIMVLYNAGRIDGIRSERARKKQKAAPKQPDLFEVAVMEQRRQAAG